MAANQTGTARRLMVDLETTMGEQDAHAFIDALRRLNDTPATVRRLMVGAKSDHATEWFIVGVPAKSVAAAESAMRWWKAGGLHHRIELYREHIGGTYADAAHRFGYPEVMPVPPCVASMHCLCAGHARGIPAHDPCDTLE